MMIQPQLGGIASLPKFGNQQRPEGVGPRNVPTGQATQNASGIFIPSSEESRLQEQGFTPNQSFAARLIGQIRDFLGSERFTQALSTLPPEQGAAMLQQGLNSLEAAMNVASRFGVEPQMMEPKKLNLNL